MPKKKEIDFLKHYVKPHNKVAREVKEEDLKRVAEDAHIMFNLCFTKRGMYQGAYAVAHPQINDTYPLRFYVTKDKLIVINPVITRHTRHTVSYVEGCTSFPDNPRIETQRWNKCEMDFQTIEDDGKGNFSLSEVNHVQADGHDAKIIQHEIDHLDGKLIFPF